MHVTCNVLLNKKRSHSNFNDMCCDKSDSLYPHSIAWFRSSIHGRVLGSRDGSIKITINLVPSGEISSQSEIKTWKYEVIILGALNSQNFFINPFHATLLVSLESSWWVRVHQLGLRLFGVIGVEAIDYWTISSMKIKKNKKKWKLYWILGGVRDIVGKPSTSQI
jgi:hypothetical protein